MKVLNLFDQFDLYDLYDCFIFTFTHLIYTAVCALELYAILRLVEVGF